MCNQCMCCARKEDRRFRVLLILMSKQSWVPPLQQQVSSAHRAVFRQSATVRLLVKLVHLVKVDALQLRNLPRDALALLGGCLVRGDVERLETRGRCGEGCGRCEGDAREMQGEISLYCRSCDFPASGLFRACVRQATTFRHVRIRRSLIRR